MPTNTNGCKHISGYQNQNLYTNNKFVSLAWQETLVQKVNIYIKVLRDIRIEMKKYVNLMKGKGFMGKHENLPVTRPSLKTQKLCNWPK